MKHAILFIVIGILLALRAATLGGWWLLMLWPASSFFIVGLAYAWIGAGIFGKRPDGSMAWWALLALFPYLLFTWLVWHVRRLLSGRAAAEQIVPGLWLGRRPLVSDLPADVAVLVDLT